MKRFLIVLCAVGMVCILTGMASALTLNFESISSLSATSKAIGEAQFKVEVTSEILTFVDDPSWQLARFTFTNTGPGTAAIYQIFFDEGLNRLQTRQTELMSTSGTVAFTQVDNTSATADLIGGSGLIPVFAEDHYAYATGSGELQRARMVDPGESLGLVYRVWDGVTFSQVEESLLSGDLRIGINARFSDELHPEGGFLAVSSAAVPEPTTLLLLGIGLIGLAGLSRKKFLK